MAAMVETCEVSGFKVERTAEGIVLWTQAEGRSVAFTLNIGEAKHLSLSLRDAAESKALL